MRPARWLLAAALLAGCGDASRPSGPAVPRTAATLRVSSPAFPAGARLPRRFTCDGAGTEPPVAVRSVPRGARELVLVVSDSDAPGGTFVHLTRYGLRPGGRLDRGGRRGRDSAGKVGWTPPCPPRGDCPHRYVWSVYALRAPSRLPVGAEPTAVASALGRDVLASGTLTATYARR